MNYIISVTMVNTETKEEVLLTTKKGKTRCHFNEWFSYDDYEIQLRFDYNDNPYKSPTLDADIRKKTTGKLIKKGPWHHTEAKYDAVSNIHIYTFRFDGLELRLSITTMTAAEQLFTAKVGKSKS
jgi:glyceraldehyde-3-phosphate dehydrogenase/erythrose-4-phosphate dehydrogenase